MIFSFAANGIIRKKNILIQYYKKAGLNENQLAIVLLVMELSKTSKLKFLTPTSLSEYMTLSPNEIEKQLALLNDEKLIVINGNSKKNNFLDLTPLFNKIFLICESELAKNNEFKPAEFIERYYGWKITENQLIQLEQVNDFIKNKSYILEIVLNNNINTFEDLIKVLKDKESTNIVKLTQYNWLNE